MNPTLSLIKEEDIPYEEDCLRNPYAIKTWLRYLAHKSDATLDCKVMILSRAVNELPGSYKLYMRLLEIRVNALFSGPPDPETGLRPLKSEVGPEQPIWQKINATFERSMFLLHKFPLVWVAFCNFLMHQPWRITYTRRTFDRAFKSLPITQHANIWDLYLKFAANAGGETCVRIWRRYLKVQPTHSERYIDILLAQKPPKTAEAALVLSTIIEHPEKHAATGKTTYQYWSRLCDLICEYPDVIEFSAQDHMVPSSDMNSLAVRPSILDIEKIMRAGIVRFTDQVGKLWNSLASWWVLRGELERARDVYEEALANVSTVRDFKLVFDAFAQMEEKVLAYEMEAEESDLDAVDIDLRLARFERLLQRRPILLYDVLVRQNPNQVHHWMNRTKLFTKLNDIVYCFNRAVKTVNPKRAQGPLHSLWIDFANMYEKRGDLDNARKVYERAVAVPFVAIDNLATIWCQWAEMELRAEKYQNALDVLGRATAPLSGDMSIKYNDESKSPQQRIFKSIRLWSFYVDLEESVGSVESCKAVYDRILELKIATPQIITNYASFLEEKKFYEDSFRIYERGVDLFRYPVAFEIWNLYLTKFIDRYHGTKLERLRDLFEHALEDCPPSWAKAIFLLYAKVEEDYGLARNAMRIYDRATTKVNPENLFDIFTVYIAKAASFFGIIQTRDIYQKSLEILPDRQARDMAIKFQKMETGLGEVDRSRAILAYASQWCNPRTDAEYWEIWHDFEVKFGNEETYKEMLRIKRSVQSKFNTEVNFITSQILAQREIENVKDIEPDSTPTVLGFVRAEATEAPATVIANPEEIEIEDSDDEANGNEQNADIDIANQVIPKAVFGVLASQMLDEKVGAKDRFKRKRADAEKELE